MRRVGALLVGLLWVAAAKGQYDERELGLIRGNWRLLPSVQALGAYDSRTLRNTQGEGVGDAYAELGAAGVMENLGGRYAARLNALYAYRFYSTYDNLNDDRYNLGLNLTSEEDPWAWFVNTYLRKSLEYNSGFALSEGQDPGEIPTDETRRTYSLRLGTSYAGYLTEKSDLTPSYAYGLFFDDAEISGTSYWQNHDLALQYGYAYSDRTKATATASYSYQLGKVENGHVTRLLVGAESRATDHATWSAQIGVAAAYYEISGTDVAPVFQLSGSWKVTDKVSVKAYGGNDFQTGYGGGAARMTARLGYGADWAMRERWTSSLNVAHRTDVPIGGERRSEVVRTDAAAAVNHLFTRTLVGAATLRYSRDEFSPDKIVASFSISKSY